jgi:hypothetical protein
MYRRGVLQVPTLRKESIASIFHGKQIVKAEESTQISVFTAYAKLGTKSHNHTARKLAAYLQSSKREQNSQQ